MVFCPGRLYDIFEITAIHTPDPLCHYGRNGLTRSYFFIEGLVLHYLCNTIIMRMRFIKVQFIINPKPDEHSHSHAQCQPADVNKRITFIAEKISPPDL